MIKLKRVVFIINILTTLLLHRPFGSIIHDIATKYNESLSTTDLRRVEKLATKVNKVELDLIFLKNCQNLDIVPKFLYFRLPHTNYVDAKAIRKRLLRSAIKQRKDEKRRLNNDLERLSNEIRAKLSSIDWYILHCTIKRNVEKIVDRTLISHEKKLRNLSRNKVLPFKANEVITNLSSFTFTDSELELLKNGLQFALEPPNINKTDIFTSFEILHRVFTQEIKDFQANQELRTELSHIAKSYFCNYKPSNTAIKKHGILKRLRSNKDIKILKPDKGNGVIILDSSVYFDSLKALISDDTKFKKLSGDDTLKREGSLQRFLNKIHN